MYKNYRGPSTPLNHVPATMDEMISLRGLSLFFVQFGR